MTDSTVPRKIYTFGYGNRVDLQPLLDHCQTHGIQAVVDVRRNPKGWSSIWGKPYLGKALPHHGIDYLAIDALGNISGSPEWIPPEQDEAQMALRHIAELSRRKTIVLMCAEREADRCHRRQVATELSQLSGLPIEDLG